MRELEVSIILTAKPLGASDDDFAVFDVRRKTFASMKDALEFIDEQYFHKCKKTKMCTDDGSATHIGWIYCFKNDVAPTPHWQRDWVSIDEVTTKYTPVEGWTGGATDDVQNGRANGGVENSRR